MARVTGSLVFVHQEMKIEESIPPKHVMETMRRLRSGYPDVYNECRRQMGPKRSTSKSLRLPHDMYFAVLRVSRDVMAGIPCEWSLEAGAEA